MPILKSPSFNPAGAARAAVAAALGAAVLSLSAAAAGAAPGDRNPWQRTVESTCAGTQDGCSIKVLKVPAKRRLEIRNVACEIGVEDPDPVTQVFVYGEGENGDVRFESYFAAAGTASSGGIAYHAFNTDTLLFAKPKDEVHVVVYTPDDVRLLTCNLAGELITLP